MSRFTFATNVGNPATHEGIAIFLPAIALSFRDVSFQGEDAVSFATFLCSQIPALLKTAGFQLRPLTALLYGGTAPIYPEDARSFA